MMERIYSKLHAAARRKCPLFIKGPTGCGKTTLARKVHEWSGVRGPFVALNCATLPEGIAEAELFGASSGAYTDAKRAKSGYFEQASDGTLFLDEVGDLSPTNQARLLKAVEEGAIVRVGETTPRPIQCRIIAATARLGCLRADLAYRLAGVVVDVPGLAHRRAEILPLARARLVAVSPLSLALAPCAEEVLLAYDWPGNVRELHNVMEAAALDAEVSGRDHVIGADVTAAIAHIRAVATPAAPLLAAPSPSPSPWPPRPSGELLPPVAVASPRWAQAWHLTNTATLFTREDYEAATGHPRSTAGRDLTAMVKRGILRRTGTKHYTWVAGAPSV